MSRRTITSRARVVRAAAAVGCAAVALGTVRAPAYGDSSAPGGTASPSISLGLAGSAGPELGAGRHAVTLRGKDVAHHFTISKAAGESVWLSATADATRSPGDSDYTSTSLSLGLRTADGASCLSTSDSQSPDGTAPMLLTAGLLYTPSVGDGDKKCASATTLLADVETSSSLPLRTEITYLREPASTDHGTRASASELKAFTAKAGATHGDVTGGTSFDDATELQPGTSTSSVLIGKRSFFKVRAGWGQRLGIAATVPRPGSNWGPPTDLQAVVALFNPARLRVSGEGSTSDLPDQATVSASSPTLQTIGVFTPTISWANRTAADDKPGVDYGQLSQGELIVDSLAGWYYFTIRPEVSGYSSSSSSVPQGTTVPVQLNVELRGRANAGPHFAGVSASAPVTPPHQVVQSTPWPRIGIAAATVVAGLAVIVAAMRARRAGTETAE